MTYAEKLRKPNWQKKRLLIMQRDEFSCQLCGDKESTLNVHHKEYHKGKEPWEYDDENFETLCERCHLQKHSPSATEPKPISDFLPRDGSLLQKIIQEQRDKERPLTDLSSSKMLRKAWNGFLMYLSSKNEKDLVNAFGISPTKFIRENFFVLVAESETKQRLFEENKSILVDYMNRYFNGNIIISIVVDENK